MGHTQSWPPLTGPHAAIYTNSVDTELINITLHRTLSTSFDHLPLAPYVRTPIDLDSLTGMLSSAAPRAAPRFAFSCRSSHRREQRRASRRSATVHTSRRPEHVPLSLLERGR